jgi:hypothetical protein
MTFTNEPLDLLAPAVDWAADWDDVLQRAGERRPRRRAFIGRRLVLALAMLAAVLIPLAAFGAAGDWWFFGGPVSPPVPQGSLVVVKEGKWEGHPWKLVAYQSDAGLCWSFTPSEIPVEGTEAGFVCGTFAGVAPKLSSDVTISSISSSGQKFPAYIAGVVVGSAREVEIQFATGETLRLPTFSSAEPVGPVRFFASQVQGGSVPLNMVGRDANGKVVACNVNGPAPLSAC